MSPKERPPAKASSATEILLVKRNVEATGAGTTLKMLPVHIWPE
jgi:hypothetical protein